MYPKISVVVPSFNQAEFLELTLLSVIEQKYPNLELIVMDGGSTDGSVDILNKYDTEITYWVSQPDGGQTNALLEGFKRSSGEIQCWLNSDDLHMPNTLYEVAEYFAKHSDIGAVYGDTIWIDDKGKQLRKHKEIPFNKFIWLHTYNYIPGMSMFWKKEVYEKAGGMDVSFNLAMDADLWSRISTFAKIAHTGRFWSKMRFYPEQKNRRLRAASDLEDLRIRSREWGTETPAMLSIKRLIAQSLRLSWRLFSGCYSFGYVRKMENIEP